MTRSERAAAGCVCLLVLLLLSTTASAQNLRTGIPDGATSKSGSRSRRSLIIRLEAIPEPSTALLIICGAAAVVLGSRRGCV